LIATRVALFDPAGKRRLRSNVFSPPMKQGTGFEKLTASIFEQLRNNPSFETVSHNVTLPGPDGPRQIDVLLMGKVGPLAVMTIVECKDHNHKVTVQEVDALHSKMQDVKAQKAVMVARKGFSGTALKKARRLGMTLCTAHEAGSEKWPFALELPFVFVEEAAVSCTVFTRWTARATSHVVDRMRVNGIGVSTLIARYWDANPIEFGPEPVTRLFVPAVPEPHWIYVDNQPMPVTNCRLEVVFQRSYYFGYFNAIDSVKCLEFVGEQRREFVYDPLQLIDYRGKLTRFDRREDVPNVANLTEVKLQLIDARKVSDAPANVTRVSRPSKTRGE
jgi:hypothetical protein